MGESKRARRQTPHQLPRSRSRPPPASSSPQNILPAATIDHGHASQLQEQEREPNGQVRRSVKGKRVRWEQQEWGRDNREQGNACRRRDVADGDIEDNEDENNNENNNNNDHDHDSGSGNEYDSDNDNNAEAHSHDAQDHQQGEEGSRQQAIKARSASSSSTANRGLKHTKTGKIQHKWRKAGVNRRQTAYNRYLQQQSKVLKDCRPDLSPQE
ncbi:hypothetical protein DFQ26_006745, partial [Actinomortierella ambigua]